jgi:hypothetical protein
VHFFACKEKGEDGPESGGDDKKPQAIQEIGETRTQPRLLHAIAVLHAWRLLDQSSSASVHLRSFRVK